MFGHTTSELYRACEFMYSPYQHDTNTSLDVNTLACVTCFEYSTETRTMAIFERLSHMQAAQHKAELVHWPTLENGFMGVVDNKRTSSKSHSKKDSSTLRLTLFSASRPINAPVKCSTPSQSIIRMQVVVPIQTQRQSFVDEATETFISDEIKWCRVCMPRADDNQREQANAKRQHNKQTKHSTISGESSSMENLERSSIFMRNNLPIRTPCGVAILYRHFISTSH